MIKFRCHNCNQKIGIPDEHAGKMVKCPRCKNVVTVAKPILENMHSIQTDIVNVRDETDQDKSSFNEDGVLASILETEKDPASHSQQYSIVEPTKQCPYCGETILEVARKCKYCRELLDRTAESAPGMVMSGKTTGTPYREEVGQKRWYNKTSVTLCVAALLIAIVFGFIHIISGSNLSIPRLALKDSFGYSETFINVDKITGMPWLAAKLQCPISCKILQERGFIESDDEFQRRVQEELERELQKIVTF